MKLQAVSFDYFSKDFFAPRPPYEEMRNFVLDLRSMNDMPQWKDALEVYLRERFSKHFK